MRFYWLWLVALLVPISTAVSDEGLMYRYLEFRDGSVLRLAVVDEDWDITTLKSDGTLTEKRVRLSSLPSFTLTREKNFARKQALLSAVRRLGAEDFRTREQALAELIRLGPDIRADLESCLHFSTDVETQGRLRTILAGWPLKQNIAANSSTLFDVLDGQESSWGHLGDGGILVQIDGKKVRLSRDNVRRLSTTSPFAATSSGQSSAQALRRLNPNEFPAGCVEEDFDTGPDGEPFKIGENIEKLFVRKGFVLSTSVATSFVSVNNFTVTGKSRGLSAATHQPLWEGEITIRFVQPGRVDVPAGVNYFGCWLAAVLPRGTALVAYDLHGRELGKVETRISGHDFLGMHSSRLIHRLKIVPNLAIDRDYTLDDFIFSPPVPLGISHPEKFIVQLVEGERLLCPEVSLERGGMVLHGLPAGLPDLKVSHNRLQRLRYPDRGKTPPAAAGIFAELRDGSVLFGALAKNGPPVFFRRPKLLQERGLLVGLWGAEQPRQMAAPKANEIAYLWRSTHEWVSYKRIGFQDDVVVLDDGLSKLVVEYKDLSTLWLTPPPAGPAPGSWHLRTRQGDDLVLGQPEHILGKLSQEIMVPYQGQTLRLSAAEVTDIYRVPSN